MKIVISLTLVFGAIGGCSPIGESQSEIVFCPDETGAFVKRLVGEEIPKDRDGLVALLTAQNIPFEYPRTQSQSPFCDQSLTGSAALQAYFPLSDDGNTKPILKFLFSDDDALIAIEVFNQRVAR